MGLKWPRRTFDTFSLDLTPTLYHPIIVCLFVRAFVSLPVCVVVCWVGSLADCSLGCLVGCLAAWLVL